jgi:hypothetical protein
MKCNESKRGRKRGEDRKREHALYIIYEIFRENSFDEKKHNSIDSPNSYTPVHPTLSVLRLKK